MLCEHCRKENIVGNKFYTSCGTNTDFATITTKKSKPTIKCGNCGYIGQGESARRKVSIILAWVCVVFAPIITLLYFVVTYKHRCPKCKSTFLGVKNKDGVFLGQKGGTGKRLFIFLSIFISIGILSSIVLASLNIAKQKGDNDAVRVNMLKLKMWGFSFDNSKGTFIGFCDNQKVLDLLKSASRSSNADQNENNYVCNDSTHAWAAAVPLRSGGYGCIDSESGLITLSDNLTDRTLCSIKDFNLQKSFNDNFNRFIKNKNL